MKFICPKPNPRTDVLVCDGVTACDTYLPKTSYFSHHHTANANANNPGITLTTTTTT
jgi:hypothetical protein